MAECLGCLDHKEPINKGLPRLMTKEMFEIKHNLSQDKQLPAGTGMHIFVPGDGGKSIITYI